MSFVNKVVLITGGSSGIGAASAIAFTKEGANVAIVGRNEEKLKGVIEKCTSAGKKPLSIKADITNKGEPERIVKETIEAFGAVDVLVNNAGLVRLAKILDSNILEAYDLVMNTNLRAQIHLTHLVGPSLIKSKGNIINISSIATKTRPTHTANIVYGISKAAFTHFSRAAAAEFAPHGVRVNSVSPGPVETDIMDNAGVNNISFSDIKDQLPLRRISEPEEIADIVLYIASDKAKAITGSDYIIDNGYLLKF
ncbi:3-oxoacyl-[acyl-carrier-protein] reductase FabG-like [Maniola hyperantus]|uniref:3-oxoacyl-[acyl-carrier-protein] reductase FabG-like n=1 Tax=Aphantopus hyperantus TaxID=2795564 RepID=UPI001568B32F|nr:3-oxoacyl-[acyl-carrier-protein] reductase FabG-like [Maniola hyperantus]